MVEEPVGSAAAEKPPVENCELLLLQLFFNLLPAFKSMNTITCLHMERHA